MRHAVFLDRDGTINKDVGLLIKPEDLSLIPGAAEGIKLLNNRKTPVIVVTNQPVVARNLIKEEGVEAIHDKLQAMLKDEGALVEKIYFCPHHPETGHREANDLKYRRECECRKPKIGMLIQAKKELDIDLTKSFMVGDKTTDIQAGKAASCTTILVETGSAGKDGQVDVKPDHVCKNLLEACKLIVGLLK